MEIKPGNKLRSPIRFFGGKGKFVKNLLPLIPRHRVYIEVFGGGGNLLFAKEPSEHEIYNDINGELVNFFRVLREPSLFSQFMFRISMTLYSRSEFNLARDRFRMETDPVMKAYYFFVCNRQSFSGVGISKRDLGGWGYDLQNNTSIKSWNSILRMLPAIHERLRFVYVEESDFRKLMGLYKTEDVFYYLDPPYVWGTRRHGRYDHEMSNRDHEELVEIILGHPGMIMLSGYEHEIYRPLEAAGWEKREFGVKCTCSNGRFEKKQQDRIECVWRNPACVGNCEEGDFFEIGENGTDGTDRTDRTDEEKEKFEGGSLKFEVRKGEENYGNEKDEKDENKRDLAEVI